MEQNKKTRLVAVVRVVPVQAHREKMEQPMDVPKDLHGRSQLLFVQT